MRAGTAKDLGPSVEGPDRAPSRFRELTIQVCRERLAEGSMGRVAWSAGGVQNILPVSYRMYGGRVVFRTSPYGSLSHLQHPAQLAFEIDHADLDSGRGWSVVVQGQARPVVRPQDLAALWASPDLLPWSPGTRNVFFAIVAQTITGREITGPALESPSA